MSKKNKISMLVVFLSFFSVGLGVCLTVEETSVLSIGAALCCFLGVFGSQKAISDMVMEGE